MRKLTPQPETALTPRPELLAPADGQAMQGARAAAPAGTEAAGRQPAGGADHGDGSGSSPQHSVRARWRGYAYVVLAFLPTMALITWFASYGTWQPFHNEMLGFYYDALGNSLLHGRFDVFPAAVGFEAFISGGKYYGYFGMTPALFRIPLNFLVPALRGEWGGFSVILGSLASVWIAYRLSGRLAVRKPARLLFLWAAGGGASLVFMASRPFVYHEASVWGGALSLAAAYCLFRYAREGTLAMLAAAGAWSFFALFARPTTGAGAVLAMLAIALLLAARSIASRIGGAASAGLARLADSWGTPRVERPGRDALLATFFVALAVGCYVATNYLKFGTWDGVPVDRYIQYIQQPNRLRAIGGAQLHLANLPTGLDAYFGRLGLGFSREFPWVVLPPSAPVRRGALIDVNDWSSSVPGSMPALFLLACWGAVRLAGGGSEDVRRLRLPTAALAAGGAIVLCTVGICQRYVHDFYPALVLAAAVGVADLARGPHPRVARRILLAALTLLVLVSIAIETAFALQYQRDLSPGVSRAQRAEYRCWQRDIDAVLRT
jgi:hypothetical protein